MRDRRHAVLALGRTGPRFVTATISGLAVLAVLTACGGSTVSGAGRVAAGVAPPTEAMPPTGAATTANDTTSNDTVSFHGVTVRHARDLDVAPDVTSSADGPVTDLLVDDLVSGTGPAAGPASTVTVQYVGVLYSDGTPFDSSWERGRPADFPLRQVVPGFARAIGGTAGIPPMQVGGRRLMIIPASLGYGSQASGPIPANSVLVFVVDLEATT